MVNRIFPGLNRWVTLYLNGRILPPILFVLAVIAIGVLYVRLVNFHNDFMHAGYSRAQVLSAVATHSETSLPSLHMSIMLQNEGEFRTVASSEWMNTLNGDIICVELKQREVGDQIRISLVSNQKCEQLPPWSPNG